MHACMHVGSAEVFHLCLCVCMSGYGTLGRGTSSNPWVSFQQVALATTFSTLAEEAVKVGTLKSLFFFLKMLVCDMHHNFFD